ncbi:MAG: bifunctional 3-demethylubiquinone 3-O-methyltransferase/2-octaprenyl-6-hydroxy phenol methylase [Thermodesulfobacteriota bacterium]|nr:MAG: bifunctional 3-demethylubiquinone 3-O-methyltransferase/2-octaprenyl-6-hydroxy phenol methylase [Thermodesulfobacteriota bacterium]
MTIESEKFNSFGDEWWDPKGKLFALHRINPLRFDYFSDKAGGFKGKRVLDIGCGGGILSESFSKDGAIVTAIDLSPVSIEAAKRHAEKSNLQIDYRVISVEDLLKETHKKFDCLVCSEMLEHVDDVAGFLGGALKGLKKGGFFFFSTINRTLKARVFAIYVAERILGMIPKGAHDFKRFIKPSELDSILRDNGVTLKDLKGMTYDPLKLDFKLSGDVSVNYLGYGVKDG